MRPWVVVWTYRTGERKFLVRQDGRFYWGGIEEASRFPDREAAEDFIDERIAEGRPVAAEQVDA